MKAKDKKQIHLQSRSRKRQPVDADIAILDTGVSLTHPDLNVYRNVSFVDGVTSGNDDQGHGSHVAE